jgi:hypothetical protein
MFFSTRFVFFDIAQYSYRQLACPLHELGKANATIRLGVGTAGAVGALTGGGLGTLAGARTTIAVTTTLLCLAALPILAGPLLLHSSPPSERRSRWSTWRLPTNAPPPPRVSNDTTGGELKPTTAHWPGRRRAQPCWCPLLIKVVERSGTVSRYT